MTGRLPVEPHALFSARAFPYSRNLSERTYSAMANDSRPPVLFLVPKYPGHPKHAAEQRIPIPMKTPPEFQGLRPEICSCLCCLATHGHVVQAPNR